jgi:hypothetical protein
MGSNRWTMTDIEKMGLKIVNTQKVVSKCVNLPKKQKYNNVKTEGFDSKHEYNCFKELELRQKTGKITALVCQVTFHLITGVSYKADFVYFDKSLKKFIVADAKGMKTKEYIIKKKMMKEILGIEILEM